MQRCRHLQSQYRSCWPAGRRPRRVSRGDRRAIALACLVAPPSREISFADKRALAIFFDGRTNVHARKKISVIADKIVCRYSDVDITSRSCDLTFRETVRKLD